MRVEPLESADGTMADHLVLGCTEPSANSLFGKVVSDILDELRAHPGDPQHAVEDVLRRWSWFWGVPPRGLSDEQVVGLFAELWFMERWIGPVTADRLRSWTGPGPERDRHDCKTVAASVEVKATRAASEGATEHRISNIDQLADPERGRLLLFSLRAVPDPIGTHSLVEIIRRISGGLTGDLVAVGLWNERLAKSGYSPLHDDRYRESMRIVAQELYRVDGSFPRITRETFPAGVDRVSYAINLAAAVECRIAVAPSQAAAEQLRREMT